METNEIIVGLDVGTTKIAIMVGKKGKHNKIDILGYGKAESIGVNRGTVANIENTVQSIKAAVAEAENKSKVEIGEVIVGIAGQHIKSLQHRGHIIRHNIDDEISQEDVDRLVNDMFKLVMQPGEEIIDVIPQDYNIDGEQGIKQPIGMSGNCLEANFHIITGQTTSIKNIYKCVTKSNLEIVDLMLEPLASADAVLSDVEKEAGVALVDIGGGTTDIAIFQDGIIRHTAVIPLGGNIVTEDIKEGCTIIKSQAELLKIKFGSALASENSAVEIVSIPGLRGRPPKEISLKNLASIIQARMEEIIDNVIYEIKSSGFEKKLIAGIVLTGGGANMKHILQLTEFMTGMDVRIGFPSEHLSNTMSDELANPMFATGIGLVIRGLNIIEKQNQNNKQETSGEPEKEEKPKKEKKSWSFWEKFKDLLSDEGIK